MSNAKAAALYIALLLILIWFASEGKKSDQPGNEPDVCWDSPRGAYAC